MAPSFDHRAGREVPPPHAEVSALAISVIIPTLNEQEVIPDAIQALLREQTRCEVLVVDGGSQDGTASIVSNFGSPVRLIEQERDGHRGRGAGYNQAARLARGDILVFLHADTKLPPGGLGLIETALSDPTVVGGGFPPTFGGAGQGLQRRVLAIVERFWCFVTWRFRWFVGDQAPFVRREVFFALGGYPAEPLADDLAFAGRLRSLQRLVVIDQPVLISVRRHLSNGVLKTILVIGLMDLLYWAGVKPSFLARLYRRWLPHER